MNANEPRKAFSSARQKRARDSESDEEEEEEAEGAEDDRKRKRQRVEEVQRRAKIERERRDTFKEEEEEEEEEEVKGEGTSRGALGGRIMRHRPTSKGQGELQVANEGIGAKPQTGSSAGEKQEVDNESSDDGDDEEEEPNHGPVDSDAYEGGIFGSSEDEAEEVEVIELTDAHSDSETEEAMDAQEVDEQLITASKSEPTTSLEK
jgi:hypothetical protein